MFLFLWQQHRFRLYTVIQTRAIKGVYYLLPCTSMYIFMPVELCLFAKTYMTRMFRLRTTLKI